MFEIVPPNTAEPPGFDRLHDVQINLQAFIANLYGSSDNLAWVWVHEKQLTDDLPLNFHPVAIRASAVVRPFGAV